MGRLKGKGMRMGLQLNGLSESHQTELNLEINCVEEAVRSGSYPAALSSPLLLTFSGKTVLKTLANILYQ